MTTRHYVPLSVSPDWAAGIVANKKLMLGEQRRSMGNASFRNDGSVGKVWVEGEDIRLLVSIAGIVWTERDSEFEKEFKTNPIVRTSPGYLQWLQEKAVACVTKMSNTTSANSVIYPSLAKCVASALDIGSVALLTNTGEGVVDGGVGVIYKDKMYALNSRTAKEVIKIIGKGEDVDAYINGISGEAARYTGKFANVCYFDGKRTFNDEDRTPPVIPVAYSGHPTYFSMRLDKEGYTKSTSSSGLVHNYALGITIISSSENVSSTFSPEYPYDNAELSFITNISISSGADPLIYAFYAGGLVWEPESIGFSVWGTQTSMIRTGAVVLSDQKESVGSVIYTVSGEGSVPKFMGLNAYGDAVAGESCLAVQEWHNDGEIYGTCLGFDLGSIYHCPSLPAQTSYYEEDFMSLPGASTEVENTAMLMALDKGYQLSGGLSIDSTCGVVLVMGGEQVEYSYLLKSEFPDGVSEDTDIPADKIHYTGKSNKIPEWALRYTAQNGGISILLPQ